MPKKKNATRKDGRVKGSIYIGKVNGIRKYKYVYGSTQKEVDAKIDEIKAAMRKGLDVSAGRDTFGAWAERFLALKSAEVSRSQADVYKSAITHLTEYIGDQEIIKVKAVDIQTAINDLAKKNPNTSKPAAKRTLEVVKNTANQIFRLAIENRLLDYNPATAVRLPKTAPAAKRRALTAEEQQWILDTPHRAQRAAMIMMYAGLRRGELIPLMWSDIDFEAKTIRVDKAVNKNGNRFEIKSTAKTESSIRIIYIPEQLVSFLREQTRTSLYVCTNQKDEMHTPSSWRKMWDSYLQDLNIKYGDFSDYIRIGKNGKKHEIKSKHDPEGVPFVIDEITPHWLRHTFASILYMSGVDVREAMEQLGHTDIKTTLGIYTHLDREHKQRSIDKMEEYLKYAGQMQVNRIKES